MKSASDQRLSSIDNANQTSTLFPSDPGYFGTGGSGVASNRNQLWGTVFLQSKKTIQSDLLVHIEAGDFAAGDYTFYSRYVSFLATDAREPLGTQWGARYFSGQEGTDLVVWRDSNAVQGPFTCNELGRSGWYPLVQTQVVAFDESEDSVEIFFDSDSGVQPGFPAETQRLRVGSSELEVAPFRAGWLFLNLRHSGFNTQSYVWVRQGLRKRASVYPALPFYNEDGGSPADASACGLSPNVFNTPIP